MSNIKAKNDTLAKQIENNRFRNRAIIAIHPDTNASKELITFDELIALEPAKAKNDSKAVPTTPNMFTTWK